MLIRDNDYTDAIKENCIVESVERKRALAICLLWCWFSPDEVAEYVGVSPYFVKKWCSYMRAPNGDLAKSTVTLDDKSIGVITANRRRQTSHDMKPLGVDLEPDELARYVQVRHKVSRESADVRQKKTRIEF